MIKTVKKILIMSGLTVFICCLFMLPITITAQNVEKQPDGYWRVGLECGKSSPFEVKGDIPEQIRAGNQVSDYHDYDYYYYYPKNIEVNREHVSWLAGIKAEYAFGNGHFGIASGLRISGLRYSLSSPYKYLLWKIAQDDVYTDYVRLDRICQTNYSLGLPVELRIYPRNAKKFVKHYFKIGASFNCLLSTNNDIKFYDKKMEHYKNAIEEKFVSPSPFNANIYSSYGIHLGKEIHAGMEIILPGFVVGKNINSFVQSYSELGIRFSVDVPLYLLQKQKQ
ncbi:MAG: hypothetical protein LBG92_10510 [Prevotellaceae bacterium]|jgi:hypothetical protein|nr:hypothetical protein [Prevotellaceae bacterium]